MSALLITPAAREMNQRAQAARARMEARAVPGPVRDEPGLGPAMTGTEAQLTAWFRENRPDRKSASAIIRDVASQHRMSDADITGPGRTKPVVAARYAAIAAVRSAYPERGMPWLAQQFQRDHATIFYYLRKLGLPTAMSHGRAA